MRSNNPLIIVLIAFTVAFLFAAGCADSIRFAPTEPQKQLAELTDVLATKINTEGTEPFSPASQKLSEGTRAAMLYMGRPAEPPDPAKFETIAAQASEDAVQRPDVWTMADSALELGIGVSALLGGVYGTKAVKYLKTAQQKSAALKEIVTGNELFKQKTPANSPVLMDFKTAQNEKQSANTKKIVSETKIG